MAERGSVKKKIRELKKDTMSTAEFDQEGLFQPELKFSS